MNTKRLLGIILAAAMLPGLPLKAAMFSDTKGLSSEAAIEELAQKNIVSGRGDGIYAPNEALTRAEMVTIILRAYGAEEVEGIEKFQDVPPTHWAYKYVETAYQMGIVSGMSETIFSPDTKVTFEQAVRMLVSAMKMDEKAQKAGGWPDGYISVAEDMGVLFGISETKGQTINRGSMAQLVYNCLMSKAESDYMIDWTGVENQYNWIRDERMRCIYGDISDIMEDDSKVLGRLVDAGINCAFLNMMGGGYDHTSYEGHRGMLEEAKAQKERYGIKMFMKINWGDDGYVRNTEFGQFHPGIYMKDYYDLPCTLSDEYCNKQLIERAKLIASYPEIDGIILDFEMYSGGNSAYTSKCMCDDCWNKYLTAKGHRGEWTKVVAENRSEYLKNNGKHSEYTEWFEGEVTKMFAGVRKAIHGINPDIIIGYFPSYEWIPGMTKGLGTPEKPVLVASENEYWGSLADTKLKMQAINSSDEIHAIYCPGLYPGYGALSPQRLEEKITQAAPTTAGYWMYDTTTLEVNEAYYAAVEKANKQLDEEIASGELTPLPDYNVRSYKASKIKGKTPTDAEWEKAPLTEDFVDYQKGEEGRVIVKSNCKVLYSDDNIFVRVYAYDDMNNVVIGSEQSRDYDGGEVDRVGIYWKFDGTNNAAQFRSDLAGSLWDGYSTGVGVINNAVNFEGYSTEPKLFDDHWEMTVRLPGTLDGVRKIKKGDILRMEIYRSHPASAAVGEVSSHCWSPTYGAYLGSQSLWGIVTLD